MFHSSGSSPDLSCVTHTMMQVCPCGTVAGVKMIQFNTFYITGGIHQAIRWVCGDRHGTTEIVYKKAEGTPLARIAPGLKSVTHCLKVDLYVFDKVDDLFGGIQVGLNSADHKPHINIGNFFMLAVCLENQENGSHPTELRGSLGSRRHERTLGEEGVQAIKGEALHVEHSSQGTEADVP